MTRHPSGLREACGAAWGSRGRFLYGRLRVRPVCLPPHNRATRSPGSGAAAGTGRAAENGGLGPPRGLTSEDEAPVTRNSRGAADQLRGRGHEALRVVSGAPGQPLRPQARGSEKREENTIL